MEPTAIPDSDRGRVSGERVFTIDTRFLFISIKNALERPTTCKTTSKTTNHTTPVRQKNTTFALG